MGGIFIIEASEKHGRVTKEVQIRVGRREPYAIPDAIEVHTEAVGVCIFGKWAWRVPGDGDNIGKLFDVGFLWGVLAFKIVFQQLDQPLDRNLLFGTRPHSRALRQRLQLIDRQ